MTRGNVANALLIGVAVMCCSASSLTAQVAKLKTPAKQNSLARFVGADAGFYVSFDQLAAGGTTAKAKQAFQLYELLVGDASTDDADTGDLRQFLLRSLGVPADGDPRDLFKHRIAVAAPSWERLADGVMIVAMEGDTDLINRVFEPISYDAIDGDGHVTVYTSKTFLAVATDGEVLVVGRRRHRDGLYRQAVQLMRGKTDESLATRPAFRRTAGELPENRDGTVFVDLQAQPQLAGLLPNATRHASAGIYFSDDRIDVTVRAPQTNADGKPKPAVPRSKLASLPQTTLAVWTSTIDPVDVVRRALRVDSSSDGQRFLAGLAEVLDVNEVTERILGKLGTDAVIAWDQHLGDGPDVPQFAILFETPQAARCSESLADTLQVVVDWFDLRRREQGGPRPRLQSSEYLGFRIHELTIPGVTEPMIAAEAGGEFQPAFAAIGRSFVLAVGADHIRNIIDARLGLAPRIGELAAFMDDAKTPARASYRAVVQPESIARTLGAWLADPQSVLSRWLTQGVSGRDRVKLGISVSDGSTPGSVKVVRVDPRSRAGGRLRAGDEILGFNDRFLALKHARADLRALMASASRRNQWTFRVRRADAMIDVSVPTGAPTPVTQSFGDPIGAVRQLQSMLTRIGFVDIDVVETSSNHLEAHLSLKFTGTDTSPSN